MLTFLDFTKRGRLGNQMFRVAATIGIAVENGTEYAFPEWVCNRSKKDFGSFFARPLPKIRPGLKVDGKIAEKGFAYSEVKVPSGTFTLSGFFQTERYFENSSGLVREYFEPKKEVKDSLVSKYGVLVKDSCSLHVRRTDYVHSQTHHPVIDVEYYRRALELVDSIHSPKRFLVFSDDIGWCKRNLDPEFVYIEGNQEIEDMFIMSMCSHHIIANSSFSWWGAWLNPDPNKLVVFPSVWFGPSLKHHDTSDITPKTWVRVQA